MSRQVIVSGSQLTEYLRRPGHMARNNILTARLSRQVPQRPQLGQSPAGRRGVAMWLRRSSKTVVHTPAPSQTSVSYQVIVSGSQLTEYLRRPGHMARIRDLLARLSRRTSQRPRKRGRDVASVAAWSGREQSFRIYIHSYC